MSLEVVAMLVCNGCGERVSRTEHRFTYAKICAQRVKEEAERQGWLSLSRGRYNVEGHYCPECKDKPMRKIKKPEKQQP